MGGFFVTGKIPEKWRLIWHFSHLQSTLYRPSLSLSALALAYGVWSICWRATARITRAPLKKSENILVFYQKSPVYNPQFTYGKPYTRVHSRSGTSSNYGKFERQGSESNDGRRYPGNVLFVPTVSGGIHPTQKPVELCEYLIRTYTHPGELVADICVGSGTTAIAAINTERRFVCFETAPSFYAAASERIRAAQAVKSSGEKGV